MIKQHVRNVTRLIITVVCDKRYVLIKKQTQICIKIGNFTVNRDHSYKKMVITYTPVDILVGN